MDTQRLLLVDNNDNFLGYEEKEVCHTGQGIHHRGFVVCIFNDMDQILLQKRKHKRFDNLWDVTAISHPLHLPDHDETYEEAGLRALKDEMGIQNVSLQKIGGFNYFAKYGEQCENEYCAVLTGRHNGEVHINSEMVYESNWMSVSIFIKDCGDNSSIYAPWTLLTANILAEKHVL